MQLHPTAQTIRDLLQQRGIDTEFCEFSATTRSAQDAAAAIGCELAQIGKSLIFRLSEQDVAVLIIASGANRVDQDRVGVLLGGTLAKADADFVREKTGFAIGGVPPFGHKQPLVTLIDRDLLKFEQIWLAGGTPNSVFKLSPQQLEQLTQGKVVDLS